MKAAKFCVVFVTAALSLSAWNSASAASPMTVGFAANVRANVAFLDSASRIALGRSDDAGTRVFARGEPQDATKTAALLRDVIPPETMAASNDSVMTGRSVAVDGTASSDVAGRVTVDQAANGRAAMGQDELDRLRTLSGREFNDLYWQTQLDALSQLESDYRTYIAHGDDQALVATAKRELPRVMRRLALLTKI